MRSQAVVLTYPGHFLLSKLTIDSIKKHISSINDIVVIVDDLSIMSWPGYTQDCQDLYNVQIIPSSTLKLPNIEYLKKHPWIKQQIIKFYLDVIFPQHDEIFFSDGDVVFYHDVDYLCVPYFRMTQEYIHEQQTKYISLALGVDYNGIILDNRVISTSGPPFRDIQLDILPQLRSAVESNNKCEFSEYHCKLIGDQTQSVSEWELLEFFKQKTLDMRLDLQYYHLQYLDQNLDRDPGRYFGSCFCCDKIFGKQWWQDNTNVDYKKYWAKLPIMKYY